MASAVKFQPFVENLAEKAFNLGSDTLKLVLTNTAPTAATDDELADITQIANGNGYTTGGAAVTVSSSSQSGGTYALVGTGPTWTASGGTIGPFRYVVLYSDTSTGDKLICYWDYGSALTLQIGDSFTVNFSGNIVTLV